MSDNDIVASSPATGSTFTPAPGESDRAFAAFCAYLELGPGRRYVSVARQVGASLISIKRWAVQFDWRGRVNAQAARGVEQVVQLRDAERQETVSRENAIRERQLVLAEAILDVSERYFERLEDLDLEQVRLPDVCRALEFANRLVGSSREANTVAAPDHSLRDQLTALLDRVIPDTPKPVSP